MPGLTIKEFDLAAYAPRGSRAIVGVVGLATKGPVNQLNVFTDIGNYVNTHGRPGDNHYAGRASIRYLRYGNQLKFVRVAGKSLATAYVQQWKIANGKNIPIVKFEAISPGTWANDVIKIGIVENGDPVVSYNVYVFFQGRIVERFNDLNNSILENEINGNSFYIKVKLHENAGNVFPDPTIDLETEAMLPLILSNGDDGAFASTKTSLDIEKDTGGLSAKNYFNYNQAPNTTAIFSGKEDSLIVPGSFTVTDGVETFTDNGKGVLVGSASGTGWVDYPSGSWRVVFFAVPVVDVNIQYYIGTSDILGTTIPDVFTYQGKISRPGVCPRTVFISTKRCDQADIGDGIEVNFSFALASEIRPGTLLIEARDGDDNLLSVTDDSEGNLVGNIVAGTIDYSTGAVVLEFSAPVLLGGKITAFYRHIIVDNGSGLLSGSNVVGSINYETGEWSLVYTLIPVGNFVPNLSLGDVIYISYFHVTAFYGDGVLAAFSGQLDEYPIKPHSVNVTFANAPASPLTDDGNGNLVGVGGSGTIDYLTGEYSIIFSGPPADGFAVYITSDVIILHFTSVYPGDIGNRRDVLTDGLYIHVDRSSSSPSVNEEWYRVRIFFNDGTGAGPVAVETFDNLKSITDIVDAVNASSKYIRVSHAGYIGKPNVAYDSYAGQRLGMYGAVTAADIVGYHVGAVYTGMQLFSNYELVPLNFLTTPGVYHRQVQSAGFTLAGNRRVVWIGSIPNFENIFDARDYINGEYNAVSPGGMARPTPSVPYPFKTAVDNSNVFFAGLWVKFFDEFSNKEVIEPPEGDILALIAQVDQRFEPWFTISGELRGQLQNIIDVRYSPSEGERKLIYGVSGVRTEVLNPIVNFVGRGIYLYGQRTASRTPGATDRLHVRWTSNLIAERLMHGGRRFIFELNDEVLWREISAFVQGILDPIKSRRGIEDFRILCDSTTNSPQTIAQKKVIVKMFIKFVEVAEEIEFQLIYTPTTVSFDEVAPLG